MAILARAPFGPDHLVRWLDLFDETVDECFVGPTAARAKHLARQAGGSIGAALDRFPARP